MSNHASRRSFIGGSDARIIMGEDETALLRHWREKRGEVEPEDLSGNLIVQLGNATEGLDRHWYERNTGQVVADVQRRAFHPVKRWMAATLDGRVEGTGAVFEAKFALLWTFSEEAAAGLHGRSRCAQRAGRGGYKRPRSRSGDAGGPPPTVTTDKTAPMPVIEGTTQATVRVPRPAKKK